MVLSLALIAAPAMAETEPVIRITGAGEIVAIRELGNRDPSTIVGADPVRTVEGVSLLHRTSHIEARLCLRFGMLYQAENLAPGERVEVTIRSEHPALQRPDGRVSTGIAYPNVVQGGHIGYVGFTFDRPWESVAGAWSFAVLYHGKVLAEQRFDVSIPGDGGQPLPGECAAPVS